MRMRSFCVLILMVMAACGNTDRGLRDLRAAGGGPDEFAVVPVKPLEIPQTRALPQPTPGGANRTDPTPRADAIRALGGSAAVQATGTVPASDGALVSYAARYGVDPAIRAELAAADATRRNRARRTNLFNPFGRDRYFPAYANQALDASGELVRLRAAGMTTPTPPRAQ